MNSFFMVTAILLRRGGLESALQKQSGEQSSITTHQPKFYELALHLRKGCSRRKDAKRSKLRQTWKVQAHYCKLEIVGQHFTLPIKKKKSLQWAPHK